MPTGYQGTGGDICLQDAGGLGPGDEQGWSFLEELRKPLASTNPSLEMRAQTGNLHSLAQLALSMVRLLAGDYSPQHLRCWHSEAETTASSWDSGDLSMAACRASAHPEPARHPFAIASCPQHQVPPQLKPNLSLFQTSNDWTSHFEHLSLYMSKKKKSQNQILLESFYVEARRLSLAFGPPPQKAGCDAAAQHQFVL